jgi:hypothetical protein
MISVQANAPAYEPFLEYGHETTHGRSELEYVQIHRFQGALFQRKRVLDMPAVERLIEQSLKTPDDAHVGRAFRWYRKGLMEEDALDRFAAFWLALENLNPVLARLLGETPEIRSCANCGGPYEVDTLKGVRRLFHQNSRHGLRDFRECREVRVGIMHGVRPISSVSQVVDLQMVIARKMVRRGLGLILGLSDSELGGDPEPYFTLQDSWQENGAVETSAESLGNVCRLICPG